MASYADQIQAATAANLAVQALSEHARDLIAEAFRDYDAKKLDAQTIRHRIEAVVRNAYRTAASLAPAVAQKASDVPEWVPAVPFNNEYLQSLLIDVRRNLREYKAGDDTVKRRTLMNIQHSAGVATDRGYTDSVIAAYTELEDFGYEVEKMWLNSFRNGNVPCKHCRELHGKRVGLKDEFAAPTLTVKVYKNLQGPPRHPRCHCYLVILVRSLENALEPVVIDNPVPPPQEMSTKDVKSIPARIFKAVVTALAVISKKFRRKKDA